jgi:hypothetical protein
MYVKVLSKAFQLYKKNFIASLGFAILLVSVIVFASFANVFISSGSLFAAYVVTLVPLSEFALMAASVVVFLLLYSFFLTVIVFSVRKALSTVKLHYYVTEAIRKFSFKLFRFFLALSIALYALQFILQFAGFSPYVALALMFIISLLSLFVSQAIVVDELSVRSSISNNLDFVQQHPVHVLFVLVLVTILLAVLNGVEFALDHGFLLGNYVSLIISLVFVLPFVEIVKTYLYMTEKFDLIGQQEKQSR